MTEAQRLLRRAAAFHGHTCPGLALGTRVAQAVLRELGPQRARDEELVAVVENDSCAVDAIQALLGCTFGKGNLLFRDYGKQVYTFIRRPGGQALRVVVKWRPPEESPQEREAWQRYMRGERGPEVQRLLHRRRSRKLRAILQAPLEELLHIRRLRLKPPPEARLQRSIPCARCGQRVMEGKTRLLQGQPLCIPCYERRCRCRA